MEFKESRPIYLQITDRICDDILMGQYAENARIPSVREYASLVEVNANTMMRAYDYLQNQGIIYNKRGIGYFVADGARTAILSLRRQVFLHETLEEFFRQVQTLGIPMEEIVRMYNEYCDKNNKCNNAES